ncbi:MAG: methionine biosynthesis protein MetW [Chloroflexi bacterium]|nr:methionine biosynthesis protein MetW [Chloroflexota bacterium]
MTTNSHHPRQRRRPDHELIAAFVPEGSRVLDLGCGDGQLLSDLAAHKNCVIRGIEINELYVREAIHNGVPVYHGDMLEGMGFYRDGSFDVVVLSQTLQQTLHPQQVLKEMLRVGDNAIISFPNFGLLKTRLQLLLSGKMPRHEFLPYTWYDTPNVHLCTITDFRELCMMDDLLIRHEVFLSPQGTRLHAWVANWLAGLAIFEVTRKPSE